MEPIVMIDFPDPPPGTPNSRPTTATTDGVARRLGALLPDPIPIALDQGGGDLNGSQTTAFLQGQAGTSGQQGSVPRALKQSASNYCGIV
jgi:hypothetical protein